LPEGLIKLSQRDWIIFLILVLIVPCAIVASSGGTWIIFFTLFTLEFPPILVFFWPSSLGLLCLFISYVVAHFIRKPEDLAFGNQKQMLTIWFVSWFLAAIVYTVAFVESPLSLIPIPHVPLYGIIKIIHQQSNENSMEG
jgi:hypothetical protein